jgi:Flp pilus assembly pilin Flp
MHKQDNSGANGIKYGLIAIGIVAAIVFAVQVTAPVGKGTFQVHANIPIVQQ